MAPKATESELLPVLTQYVHVRLRELHQARAEHGTQAMGRSADLLELLGQVDDTYGLPEPVLLLEVLAKRVKRLEVALQDEREQRRHDLERFRARILNETGRTAR